MPVERIESVHTNTRQLPIQYNISGMDKITYQTEKIYRYSDGFTIRQIGFETLQLYNQKGKYENTSFSKIDIMV